MLASGARGYLFDNAIARGGGDLARNIGVRTGESARHGRRHRAL